MTVLPGYNPIKWDCDQSGCWNIRCRPKIQFFKGALPNKIAMTDIDGTVEVNGCFLFLEWKSHTGELPTGQRIYFERLTRVSEKMTAVIVAGDPETMSVDAIKVIHGGTITEWMACDLEQLFERVKRWAEKVGVRIVASTKGGSPK
jgi:hypothetical protein